MRLLGKIDGKTKIRLKLAGGLENNWQNIMDALPIRFTVGDRIWHNLDNIEIDIWLDEKTGQITVDGAW